MQGTSTTEQGQPAPQPRSLLFSPLPPCPHALTCRLQRARLDCRDLLSALPAEVLSDIFDHLAPNPPFALSRRLLPYSRAALLSSVRIHSFNQLKRFVETLKASPGLGLYVRAFGFGPRELTPALLALETAFTDTLAEALSLIPAVKTLAAPTWMVSSFLLSDNGVAAAGPNVETLRLALFHSQINSLDFVTYRLALLSKYPRLRNVQVYVTAIDESSVDASAFDLFPASDLSPPPLDMIPVSHVERLAIHGALCDQRVVNLVRAFRNVRGVTLVDTFASRHIAPALAALDATHLERLTLTRETAAPPFVDLPAQETDWTRFTSLRELWLGMPVPSPDALAAAVPSFERLEAVSFAAGSDPSAALVQQVIVQGPPRLRRVEVSSLTGQVGAPISPETLPSVALWVDAVRSAAAAASDPSFSSPADPPAPVVAPVFPLLDWRLPEWTASFSPSDAEALFPLARARGVALEGSLLSACLTTYVLERQMDLWSQLVGDGGGSEDGVEAGALDLGEEEREAVCDRSLWDALALRYRARLTGEELEGVMERSVGEDSMGASFPLSERVKSQLLTFLSTQINRRPRRCAHTTRA